MNDIEPYVESKQVKDIRQGLQIFLALITVIGIGWVIDAVWVNPEKWDWGRKPQPVFRR